MNAPANQQVGALPLNAAAHQAFSFLADRLKHNPHANFAASVLDIMQGITVCLEIVHNSDLARTMNRDDPDDQQLPLVDTVDTERLLRLATASAALMADRAEKQIEWMNKYLDKESTK